MLFLRSHFDCSWSFTMLYWFYDIFSCFKTFFSVSLYFWHLLHHLNQRKNILKVQLKSAKLTEQTPILRNCSYNAHYTSTLEDGITRINIPCWWRVIIHGRSILYQSMLVNTAVSEHPSGSKHFSREIILNWKQDIQIYCQKELIKKTTLMYSALM